MVRPHLGRRVRFTHEHASEIGSGDNDMDAMGPAGQSTEYLESASPDTERGITRKFRFHTQRRGGFGAVLAESSRGADVSEERAQSLELHEACLSCPSLSELRRVFDDVQQQESHSSNTCSYPDPETGRMPLHCVGLNQNLVLMSATGGSEQSLAMVEKFVLGDLIPAHPVAIVEEDHKGRIPFTEAIISWIKTRRALRGADRKKEGKQGTINEDETTPSRFDSSVYTQYQDEREENDHSFYSSGTNPLKTTHDDIPPMVEWCLIMLSCIINKPSKLGLGADISKHRLGDDSEPDESDRSRSIFREVGTALTAFHGDVIVDKVSSIPHLMEELLLTAGKEARDRVFNLTVIRRSLLRLSSFGNGRWLMRMLASGNDGKETRLKEGGVYYLEQVSALRPEDIISSQSRRKRIGSVLADGGHSSPGLISKISAEDVALFSKKRDKLFHAIGEMDGFLLALRTLNHKLVDRAAVTRVVQCILNKRISSPFASVAGFLDGIFNIHLIVSFRACASKSLASLSSNQTLSERTYFYACLGFFQCVVFCMFRHVFRAASKWNMSRRMFWLDEASFWTLAQNGPVYMALATSLAVNWSLATSNQVSVGGDDSDDAVAQWLRIAVAVTTGALWLKLLAHLKMINKRLATFVLCIVEIMRDVKWFLLVQLIVMAAFSQMSISLLFKPDVVHQDFSSNHSTNDSCASPQPNLHWSSVAPFIDPAVFDDSCGLDDCGTSSLEQPGHEMLPTEAFPHSRFYFSAYTVMLGDFDERDYTGSAWLLFILYSFVVTIVLLNILVALVCDSYAKSMELSKSLFGRARVMFAADLDAQRTSYHSQKHAYVSLGCAFAATACYTMTVYITISSRRGVDVVLRNVADTSSSNGADGSIGWVECTAGILMVMLKLFFFGAVARGSAYDNGSTVCRMLLPQVRFAAVTTALDAMVDRIAQLIQRLVVFMFDVSDHVQLSGRTRESTNSSQLSQPGARQIAAVLHTELKEQVKMSERALKATVSLSDNLFRKEVLNAERSLVAAMEDSEDRMRALIAASEERILKAITPPEEKNAFFWNLPTSIPRNLMK